MTSYSGFRLRAVDALAEYRAEGRLWIHEATGAPVYHLDADDRETLAAFVFPTPPQDSTGVAHILEHSVLCGSRRYPTKDPFLYLLKSSLNTFLNAMTYPDKTVYPLASVVQKDFLNLLSVYADAVFHPLLKREAFQQEGHRLELDDTGALIRSGVVYNEMKGNYASAEGVIGDIVQRALFDQGPYQHDSGGDPAHIPELSYEQFLRFHADHYHPSRGLVFLYGKLDIKKVLRLLNKRAFAGFGRQPVLPAVAPQPRWSTPRTVRGEFPVGAEDDAGTLALTWLVGDATDHDRVLALDILSEILLGDAGPLPKALLASGLGQDVSPVSGLFAEIRDVSLTIGLRGAAEENRDAFQTFVLDELRRLASDGLPRNLVDSVMAAYEFSAKEVKGGGMGLRYLGRATRGWLHGTSVTESLRFQPRLEALKARLVAGERVFEALIQEALLDNMHRATVVCVPDSQMLTRDEEAVQEELAQRRMALLAKDIEGIRAAQAELKAFQEVPDPRSAVRRLPELKLSDIPPRVEKTLVDWGRDDALTVGLHPAFTNGVDYVDLAFNLGPRSDQEYRLLPLLHRCFDGLGLVGQSWDLLARDIQLHTGGVSVRSNVDQSLTDRALVGKFYIRLRMLEEHRDQALALLERLLTTTDWSLTDRLKELIVEMRNDYQGALVPRGHVFASTRSAAPLSEGGRIGELTGGLAQLDFLTRLSESSAEELAVIASQLKTLAQSILAQPDPEALLTGASSALPGLADRVSSLMARLPFKSTGSVAASSSATVAPQRAVRVIPSTVGFVAHSVPGTLMTHDQHAAELVLSHRLKTGFLWEQIRMKGGAYGAFSMPNGLEGAFSFATYRDPHLGASLDAFRESLAESARAPLSGSDLRNTIIGTVSNDLAPRSPSEEGFLALQRRHLGITDELRQQKRDSLLRVHSRQVRDAAKRLEERFDQGYTFVLTGESLARSVLGTTSWTEDRPSSE